MRYKTRYVPNGVIWVYRATEIEFIIAVYAVFVFGLPGFFSTKDMYLLTFPVAIFGFVLARIMFHFRERRKRKELKREIEEDLEPFLLG